MKKVVCTIIAFILCFTSLICMAATTTLTDIKNTKYEDAVTNLIMLNIVGGYNDNTYKPSNKVTRAELSKMLVLAMGLEDEVKEAEKKFLSFTDVLSTHWAYGYIKVASDHALVNGYPSGLFKPEGEVTYAEATAMLLRALEYEDAVKQSELSWPNNYMTYADEKIDLFDSVSEFKASESALRGNVALLLWNALRTGTAEIVAESSKGLIYGEGTPMITKYFKYAYVEEAEITNIDFEDDYQTAEVTFKDVNKKTSKIELAVDDLVEMYGKTITLLYDEDKKEIIDIVLDTDLKTVSAEVTRISDTKIYVSNRTSGYTIPDDDNILLIGIDDLDDAVEVTLLLDGTTIEYCIARGASDVSVGIIIDDYVEIDDKEYGVEVREIDKTKGGVEYFLENEDEWPDEDDVILYYINADDFLVVLDYINSGDATEIKDVSSSELIITNKRYYEFEDEDDYTVIFVNGSRLKEEDLSDIDEKSDMVAVIEYNSHVYIFVYEDAILSTVDPAIITALENLEDIIEEAEDLDERDYSQASFAVLMDEVAKGKKLDHTETTTTINRATKRIENAIDALEKSTKKEKEILEMKIELRELVNTDAADVIEDEADYTTKSFDSFYEVYEDAVDMLTWIDADLEDLETMYDELIDAIDDLVKA